MFWSHDSKPGEVLDDCEKDLGIINDQSRGWGVLKKRAEMSSEFLRTLPPVRQFVGGGRNSMGLKPADKEPPEGPRCWFPPIFLRQHDDAVVTKIDEPEGCLDQVEFVERLVFDPRNLLVAVFFELPVRKRSADNADGSLPAGLNFEVDLWLLGLHGYKIA